MSTRVHAIIVCALFAAAAPSRAGTIKGTVKGPGGRSAAEAVVRLGEIPGKTFAPPSAHAKIDQKDMVFIPHVLAVLVGTTVDFLNSDALLHNVFTPDKCAEKFNLGSWPQGEVRSYTFKQPCVVTLLCNVHPEMEAFVVVAATPYFAVADKSGAYVIPNVPDGTYDISVWHPKLKELSQKITVAGETVSDFELKR